MKLNRRTIVTGFGPFLDVHDNPSSTIAMEFGSCHELIEVSFRGVEKFLRSLSYKNFDALVMFGVAAGRSVATLETVAQNIVCDLPDATGEHWERKFINQKLPKFIRQYDSQIVTDCNLVQSTNAGSYLCNFALFRALEFFPAKDIRFIHIPPFDRIDVATQFDSYSMFLKNMRMGIPRHSFFG